MNDPAFMGEKNPWGGLLAIYMGADVDSFQLKLR